MRNEATVGGVTVGGQPSADELRSGRFRKVINIRTPGEEGNDTAEVLAGSDTPYVHVPWTIDTVTNADIDRMRDAFDAGEEGVLIH
ncbi:MAG: hypothetical protein JOZ24_06060 [Candidatus Eremiobacteraeota bacterium]|nr:hypothetical protein [Candidatus Eremiobacteraeota bacterium]